MSIALRKEERQILETMVKFANLKKIESTAQIEEMFAKLTGDGFQIIEPENVDAYKNDQALLRERLTTITRGDTERKQVAKQIRSFLREKVHPHVDFVQSRFIYTYDVDGVEAACALGIAFLLDETRGLTSRFTQCGNPECGKFHLNLDAKGRPLKHCRNEKCKKAVERMQAAVRAKRYRAKRRRSE